MVDNYEKSAAVLKALAHPMRLHIVAGLLNEPCNVSKITNCLNLPQSSVSSQLAILKAAGIIEGQRKGNEICYCVSNERARKLVTILSEE